MSQDDRRPQAQLDDLQARIDKARASDPTQQERHPVAPPGGLAAALRLSTELVAGVVVGGGLGYFVDRFAGTKPFGLIIFIFIGFAAGTMNLIRAASRRSTSDPTPPQSGSGA